MIVCLHEIWFDGYYHIITIMLSVDAIWWQRCYYYYLTAILILRNKYTNDNNFSAFLYLVNMKISIFEIFLFFLSVKLFCSLRIQLYFVQVSSFHSYFVSFSLSIFTRLSHRLMFLLFLPNNMFVFSSFVFYFHL